MRKWLILIFCVLTVSALGFYATNLSGETTTTPETTIPSTDSTTSSSLYSYEDKQDLINQIYEDIYDEVYAELYASFLEDIQADVYAEIYAEIEAKLATVLSQTTLAIPLDEMQQQIYAVAELASQSVVGVTSYLGQEGVSLGSAVIYEYDSLTQTYYIITNEHVINEGDNFKVVFSDKKTVTATLLGYDADVDIAVLSFSGIDLNQNLLVSPLGSSASLTKGTVVLAAGNPRGYDFYGTFTMGIVAGIDRSTTWDLVVPYIQHDASINSGNSGGPLYNLQGEVVGINVAKFASEDIEGMGFAIPIDMVKDVVNSIRMLNGSFSDIAGNVSLNWVNVNPIDYDIDSELTSVKFYLPTGIMRGLLVSYLVDDGVMGTSGLSLGDLIVKIDNYQIVLLYQAYQYLNQHYQSGDTVTLWYYQLNKETLTFSTTLQSKTIILN